MDQQSIETVGAQESRTPLIIIYFITQYIATVFHILLSFRCSEVHNPPCDRGARALSSCERRPCSRSLQSDRL